MAQIDRRKIHRDGPQNRRELTGRDDFAAIGKPVEHAVRITCAYDADAHGARGAEGSAVTHERALRDLFHRQDTRLPGKCGRHPELRSGSVAASRGYVSVERMS